MSELGLQSWAAKLTTTFGEPGYPEWLNSVRADIAIWCNAGKVRLAGPKDYFEPLPIGGEFGGTRYFATRADAEEWAALDRARATTMPRTIISQIIEDI